MNKLNKFGFALALGLMLIACNNPSVEQVAENTTETTSELPTAPVAKKEFVAPQTVEFFCKDAEKNETGSPLHDVILRVDGTEKVIKTITACEVIPKEEFSYYDIPENALAACGSSWTDGEYIYAALEGEEVVVYAGSLNESGEDAGYIWKKL